MHCKRQGHGGSWLLANATTTLVIPTERSASKRSGGTCCFLLAARKSRFLHCVRHSAHSGRNDNSTLISIKTGALVRERPARGSPLVQSRCAGDPSDRWYKRGPSGCPVRKSKLWIESLRILRSSGECPNFHHKGTRRKNQPQSPSCNFVPFVVHEFRNTTKALQKDDIHSTSA